MEAKAMMPVDWRLTPLSDAARKAQLLAVPRLPREEMPNPLEFGHGGPLEKLCGDKNWVRSLLTKGWKGTQNEMTECLRALMSARDSVPPSPSSEDTIFWLDLAARLLTDSVGRINQRIHDGLMEAVDAPELSSKRRKKSCFLREDDFVRIDRAKEVSTTILSSTDRYRPEQRRYDHGHNRGKGQGGKGKGKGKGRW